MAARRERFWHRTVFWRLAAGAMLVQVAVVGLAGFLLNAVAHERSLELAQQSLALRLDAVAEEIEARAQFEIAGSPDGFGGTATLRLPPLLERDLADRFPDPLYVLDLDGAVRLAVAGEEKATVPLAALDSIAAGAVAVLLDGTGWAAAPLLDPAGLPAGGVLVLPLTQTLDEELAPSRAGYRQAFALVLAAVFVLTLAFVLLTTRWLVGRVQRVTRRVEMLGEGEYAARLPGEGPDEVGRLAAAVNQMAAAVERSIQALEATDRLRRELVANVGHDLRTPLAALSGYLEEAERLAPSDPVRAAAALAVARRQAAHAAALVADLFELAQLERAAAPPLRRAPVPVGELVRDVAAAHRPAAQAAGVALQTDLPPGLPTLDADGARLFRVLDNLVGNALRHTPAGGAVGIRVVPGGDGGVVIAVSDTGEGIAPDELARVFERYFRGGGARTRSERGGQGDGSGSGLGLAIARAVAEAHGGALTAASTVGEGSTFTLRLPAAR